MNKSIQTAVRYMHRKLHRKIEQWDACAVNPSIDVPYHSLSPIANADVVDYVEALTWALDNCKNEDIYNIALTGPYGSGKSSILKTFKAQNKNEKHVFLEISLATFKEEEDESDNKVSNQGNGESTPGPETASEKKIKPKTNEDVLRLIELSILQQIFYHEEDSKIPDSRFKKIKSFKRKNMAWATAGIITALLFGYFLFAPQTFQQLLDIQLGQTPSIIIRWVSFVVFLASMFIVIFRSIRLLYGIQISKFKIHEAEIEIDKNISKSILNNHLDEILYFFEVTDYSVVFIEDLDRFRQAEIFTKLRELNLLINKSKKVKQDVIFIYAVRDEIFRDKERTKFFDFIIPVIPVINASNSNETLSTIIQKNAYVIGKDLIEDISLFIDDMRLLYNIMNEYHLYHNLLSDELDQNKLLAMIIYKNIYPEDFVELSNEKGNLFKLLNNRKEYVAKTVEELDQRIAELKREIKTIEGHTIKDILDLRLIYLGVYVDNVPAFDGFVVDEVKKTIIEIALDVDLFDLVTSNKIRYDYYHSQNSGWFTRTARQTMVRFSDIEMLVDPNQDFETRQSLIADSNNDKAEECKHEIQTLEKAKSVARHAKVKTLLANKSIIIPDGDRQHQLFGILLRNGYIDEDHLDYISLFYEGSITKEDRSYLLGVKNHNGLDYDFKLTKIGNLIDKMRTVDFQESYSLNYHLLDFLLENDGYDAHLNAVLDQINSSNDHGPLFMEGFLLNGRNIEQFINKLVAKWKGIWDFVNKNSDFTRERKKQYLKLILHHAEIEYLKKITPYADFYVSVAATSDFLSLLADDERTKEVIAALNIKFIDLDISVGTKEMVDFIYEGNHYQIRQQIVEKMIGHAGKFNRADFESANYTAIKDSGSPKLLANIVANIDTYIKNLYLKIEINLQEPEENLRELLNDERIETTNRIKIIQQVGTKIDEISGIVGADVRKALFAESKVVATWENVINAFEYDGDDIWTELVSFITRTENVTALSQEDIKSDELSAGDVTVRTFCLALIKEPNIDNSKYSILLETVFEFFDISEIGELALEKMAVVVNAGLIFNNPENFAKLKADYPNLQRKLLETDSEDFIDNIADYTLDSEDLLYVINSDEFATEQKSTILETVDGAMITDSRNVLTAIVKLKFKDDTLKVAKNVREAIFKKVNSVDDRVKFFNMHYQFYTKLEVQEIFSSFPYPYSDIGVIYKNPVLPFGAENEYLSNNLSDKGFVANTKPDKKGYRIINFKK